MSFLDRVLHKHKAKSTAELVSRAVTALDKLEVDDLGGAPSSAASGGGGGSGIGGGMQSEHDRSREEVARALSAMKVRGRVFFAFWSSRAVCEGAWSTRERRDEGEKQRGKSIGRKSIRLTNDSHPPRPRNQKKKKKQAALYGDGDSGVPSKEAALALTADACAASLPDRLIAKLPALDFEARKDAASVCGAVFRMQAPAADGSGGEGSPGADHLLSRPGLLEALLDGYSSPAIALNCGAILRDAARDERVAELLLASSSGPSSPSGADTGAAAGGREGAAAAAAAAAPRPSRSLFDRLLSAVDAANFEVASDAFASLRDLLTRHRRVVAARLDSAPDAIFGALASLTSSSNYVSRRQGVRLLGEILLERANARAMLRYVSDPDNLKASMVLLKDPSRSIQFEAFHVFKVFVVNPNKLPAICVILASNRDKLLAHLADFQVDREDEQFREEKAVVVREISLLGGGGGGGSARESAGDEVE